jgi:hypothetical protein
MDHLANESASAPIGHPAAEDVATWALKEFEVGRLQVSAHDVLVVRIPDWTEELAYLCRRDIREQLHRTRLVDLPILCVPKHFEFQVLCQKAAEITGK